MKLQKALVGSVCAAAWCKCALGLSMTVAWRLRTACATGLPPLLLLLTLPAVLQAQFNYVTNADGTITITEYTGSGAAVTIPSTFNGLPVSSIGDYAFEFCIGLSSVTIPNTVTNIGYSAFIWCSSLTMITLDTNNPAYSSVDGVLFNKSQTMLVQYPGGKVANYTIPGSVATIGDQAFYDCPGLASVTIPSGVTSIGVSAFAYCTSLTSITIPSGVTNIGNDAFDGCSSLTSVTIPSGVTAIRDYVFQGCYSLASVTIPSSVTCIGTAAFDGCTKLASVTIPSGVTSIGAAAFQYCTKLASVVIPSGVTSIGDYAFYGCASLASVYFKSDAPSVGLLVFGGDNNATVYYLAGTTGWGTSFGGIPAVLLNPSIQTANGSFGVLSNQFGFTITGPVNIPILVEACTNLASASWTTLQTCALTNGSIYFSDPTWTNYPGRFYRIGAP
jgi:hypothetical protein